MDFRKGLDAPPVICGRRPTPRLDIPDVPCRANPVGDCDKKLGTIVAVVVGAAAAVADVPDKLGSDEVIDNCGGKLGLPIVELIGKVGGGATADDCGGGKLATAVVEARGKVGAALDGFERELRKVGGEVTVESCDEKLVAVVEAKGKVGGEVAPVR
jgi:hypothetical protein